MNEKTVAVEVDKAANTLAQMLGGFAEKLAKLLQELIQERLLDNSTKKKFAAPLQNINDKLTKHNAGARKVLGSVSESTEEEAPTLTS
jgi:hypothetical protein